MEKFFVVSFLNFQCDLVALNMAQRNSSKTYHSNSKGYPKCWETSKQNIRLGNDGLVVSTSFKELHDVFSALPLILPLVEDVVGNLPLPSTFRDLHHTPHPGINCCLWKQQLARHWALNSRRWLGCLGARSSTRRGWWSCRGRSNLTFAMRRYLRLVFLIISAWSSNCCRSCILLHRGSAIIATTTSRWILSEPLPIKYPFFCGGWVGRHKTVIPNSHKHPNHPRLPSLENIPCL